MFLIVVYAAAVMSWLRIVGRFPIASWAIFTLTVVLLPRLLAGVKWPPLDVYATISLLWTWIAIAIIVTTYSLRRPGLGYAGGVGAVLGIVAAFANLAAVGFAFVSWCKTRHARATALVVMAVVPVPLMLLLTVLGNL